MIYPKERYSSHKPRRKRHFSPFSLLIVAIVASLGIGLYLLVFGNRNEKGIDAETAKSRSSGEKNLVELWKERDYDGLIAVCKSRLEEDPMNDASLVFLGFSAFYKGSAQMTFEDKIPLLDLSIQSLRKARLLGKKSYGAEIDYVLGKAYFQKGKYFSDLSIEYIEKSIEKGYRREDSYEYLGLAYSQLGRYEKSVEYFEQAAEEKPSDLLFYTLAETYLQLKKDENAENYLRKAIDSTEDKDLEEKCRLLLGEIYISRKDFDSAEKEYGLILEINARSSAAHFALGEIYQQRGTTAKEKAEWLIKARSEWRAALRIDPTHYGARLRLY